MQYKVVYQVTNDNYYKLFMIIDFFAVMIGICALIYCIKSRDFGKIIKSFGIIVSSVLIILFVLNFANGIYTNFYVNEKFVLQPYEHGNYYEVEGNVKIVEQATQNGLDKFEVADISFVLSERSKIGYSRKTYKGGFIQEGTYLRIKYVELNSKKIIVEIAVPIEMDG